MPTNKFYETSRRGSIVIKQAFNQDLIRIYFSSNRQSENAQKQVSGVVKIKGTWLDHLNWAVRTADAISSRI